jgi:phosphate transport system permease protein
MPVVVDVPPASAECCVLSVAQTPTPQDGLHQERFLRRRHRKEQRFRWYGRTAVLFACLLLVLLLGSITSRAIPGFYRHVLVMEVMLDPELLPADALSDADYAKLAKRSIKALFPEVTSRSEQRTLTGLISASAADTLREQVMLHPDWVGSSKSFRLPVGADADLYLKGKIDRSLPESERKVSDQQIGWLESLRAKGMVERELDTGFFRRTDSREPEQAGMLGSIVGSLFTILVCILLAFPTGVLTAVYLESFAPQNRLTQWIEININNLAAVPSIIFGLLGLSLYINVFALPRSSALVGGMTLALMILPVIIVTTRASLRSVPATIRDAALGLGASPVQVVLHHAIPLALPGIMTGTILGIARALGETAPLLMIGMVAFVADIPGNVLQPASAMPVQIFLWADSPELGFAEKTSAAILVLLAFLVAINALAVYIRMRAEKRW